MLETSYFGHSFLFLKTFGILNVFYLDYSKKINLPLSAILFIVISSFGLYVVGNSTSENPAFNYHYHNLITGLVGLILIIQKYFLNKKICLNKIQNDTDEMKNN